MDDVSSLDGVACAVGIKALMPFRIIDIEFIGVTAVGKTGEILYLSGRRNTFCCSA